MAIGQDLLAVPFPEMVEKLALSIANAQMELDLKSIQIAQMMAGQEYQVPNPEKPGEFKKMPKQKIKFGKRYTSSDGTDTQDAEFSLLELGFTPSFYQFVDTIIEVKISISMTSETSHSTSSTTAKASVGWGSVKVSTVSASFSSKYSYHAEGASLIRTKLVPVPSPAILEERIRLLMQNNGTYPFAALPPNARTAVQTAPAPAQKQASAKTPTQNATA